MITPKFLFPDIDLTDMFAISDVMFISVGRKNLISRVNWTQRSCEKIIYLIVQIKLTQSYSWSNTIDINKMFCRSYYSVKEILNQYQQVLCFVAYEYKIRGIEIFYLYDQQ